MSLYEKLFKANVNAKPILEAIGITPQFFDRFRDVDVLKTNDSMKIIVATRTGGNNRMDHDDNIQNIRQHPNFISDYDDCEDSTYAYFEFSVPNEHKHRLEKYAKDKVLTIGQKFKDIVHKMEHEPNHPDAIHAMEVGKSIMDRMMNSTQKGGIIYV